MKINGKLPDGVQINGEVHGNAEMNIGADFIVVDGLRVGPYMVRSYREQIATLTAKVAELQKQVDALAEFATEMTADQESD